MFEQLNKHHRYWPKHTVLLWDVADNETKDNAVMKKLVKFKLKPKMAFVTSVITCVETKPPISYKQKTQITHLTGWCKDFKEIFSQF